MKKRGISTVVASILLVLLAVLAVIILWMILRGFIQKSASEVGTSCLTLDMSIEKIIINSSTNIIYVQVKRNAGEGNISGIRFKFYNSTTSFVKDKNRSMEELETKTFDFSDAGNVSHINQVDIAPILAKGNDREICRIIDSSKKFVAYESGGNVGSCVSCQTNYCENWGSNYCKNNDVYHNRTCHTFVPSTCPVGSCLDNINVEEQLNQSCTAGCSSGACLNPGLNKTYVPNSTNSMAWKGDSGSDPATGLSMINLAYTSNELIEISREDSGIVQQTTAGSGGINCSALISVSSCSNYPANANCTLYTDGSRECEAGGPTCVQGAPCDVHASHKILFKITDPISSIHNISIRVHANASTNVGPTLTLYAWNHTAGSYNRLNANTPCYNFCNLTAIVTEVNSYLNISGDLYISVIKSGGGTSEIRYAEIKVD